MRTFNERSKLLAACEKELAYVQKKEQKIFKAAYKKEYRWKEKIAEKVPDVLESKLQAAFVKAFKIVFQNGTGIVEKTYVKDTLEASFKVNDYAVDVIGTRKSLKKLHAASTKKHCANMAVTTVEGIGFGALGIGIPDVVAFVGVLLRGIYETAIQYGFEYNSPKGKIIILKMIECALSEENEIVQWDCEVDALFGTADILVSDVEIQLQKTGEQMAFGMLVLKFIQGIPIVGILGGISNPIYYDKIMKYVRLKYYKHYLLRKKSTL